MAKETKQVNLRIPMDMYNDLTKNGENLFNPSIVALYERIKEEEAMKLIDIKGIFTPDEWKALVSSMNGTIINNFIRYNKEIFLANNEDAEKYENSFSKFGVDVVEINNKIDGLTNIQVSTIVSRIEDFWGKNNGCGYDLEKWANF